MIKKIRHRNTTVNKKRIDPLLVAVISMLVFVPIINACSTTTTTPQQSRKTQIDTSNIETNNLQLPDGYAWDAQNNDAEEEEDDEGLETSSFDQGQVNTFIPNKKAPTSTRLELIEDQLTLLRNDFNELYPSMRRLMAIEQDMQELIMELKSLTTDVAATPVTAPTPAPLTSPNTIMPLPITGSTQSQENIDIALAEDLKRRADEEALLATQSISNAVPVTPNTIDITKPPMIDPLDMPAPVIPTAVAEPVITAPTIPNETPMTTTPLTDATVKALRIGIHSDVVRVVLDYTSESKIVFDKSLQGQIFELYLPRTTYNAKTSWRSEFVPMVTSYTATQNGGDTLVKFNLEAGTTLKSAFVIPPNSTNKNARLVIDFAQ